MNAGVIEECPTEPINYLKIFDAKKMHCLDKTWRQCYLGLEYQCNDAGLTFTWTIRTRVNQGSQEWPITININTNRGKISAFFSLMIHQK